MNESVRGITGSMLASLPAGKGGASTRPRGLARLLYIDLPRGLIWAYTAALCLLYIFVAVHTPLGVLADATHDDGLFISLGRHLANGDWLGPFSQYTLAKGPGYPLFLALSNWLGTPISLSQALLHCVAVAFFVIVAHRFIRSIVLSGLLFTLLLWHPAVLSFHLLRVLRDRIYFDQLLLLLGLLLLVLFGGVDRRYRGGAAALAGVVLGWYWLTREEGAWILPGLGVMVALAGLHAFKDRQLRAFAGSLAMIICVFATTQLGFRAVNWWVYGTFVGVDFKETNYQRALAALSSVRSGGVKDYVSLTREAMRRINEHSPTFASLAPYFEQHTWEKPCTVSPATCGEIPASWFVWALRWAAQANGHYSSPAAASTFFGKIADEIESACERGLLECKPQLIAEMPPITWHQITEGLANNWREAYNGAFMPSFPASLIGSSGTREALQSALRFLNHPTHVRAKILEPKLAPYRITGWYYQAGPEWIEVMVKRPDGAPAELLFGRLRSADLVKHFKDDGALLQRYVIETECNDDCILTARTPQGEEISRTLGQLSPAPLGIALGQGTLYVDTVSVSGDAAGPPSLAEAWASRIRTSVLDWYRYIYLPVLALGALGFVLCSLLYWRSAIWNVCYVMAMVSWILAVSRIGLLLLISATSFEAFGLHYAAPIYFMLISGAVSSCAAWLQLSGWELSAAGKGHARTA